MTPRHRIGAALVVLAAFGAGVADQLGVHGHALGELDLVPHAVVTVGHAPTPYAPAHFDRAVELQHPVCTDCLLASLRSEGAAAPSPSFAPAATPLAPVALESATPRAPFARRAPARAPPSV